MRSKTWVLLLGVLIIATFLRTYHLAATPPGLYPDEAMNGNNALQALETHNFKVFYPENNGREGLFMNIQAVFLKVIGQREAWVLRLPSAIFGILTVLGLFFLARELFRRDDAGLLAAFFLAVSFWHINFSRIGFRAIMAPFFLVWALYLFLAALRSHLPALRSTLYAILGGIFFGLGFYSYISYRVAPLLFLLFIPFYRRSPQFWKIAAFFVLTTFVVALPIGWYYLKHPADFLGRTSELSITASPHPLSDLAGNVVKTIGMLNIRGDGNWRHNLSGAPELFWPVGILFWIGAILGLKSIWAWVKKPVWEKADGVSEKTQLLTHDPNWFLSPNPLSFLLLFGWLFLATLPVVISNEGLPHALRSILMIPPLIIFAGACGIWLWHKIEPRVPRRVQSLLLIIFFAALVLNSYQTYFITWAKNPNVQGAFNTDYAALGKEIRALPDSSPKYIVVDAGGVGVPVTDPGGKVKEIPMPAQTVMFFTDSFTARGQAAHNIRYLLPSEAVSIPKGIAVFHIR